MTPVEYIRHDHLGASFVRAICDDKDCRTPIGPKIVFDLHKGYESQGATPITEKEREKADKAVAAHNRNHTIRVIVGHPDQEKGEDGNSLTVYEYKAPWSKHG